MFFPRGGTLQVRLPRKRSGSFGGRTWETAGAVRCRSCEGESIQKVRLRQIRRRSWKQRLQEDAGKADIYGSAARKYKCVEGAAARIDHLSPWQGRAFLLHLFSSGSTRERSPQPASSPHQYFAQRCMTLTDYSYQRKVSAKPP
jgi:hypothetical protein